MKLKPLASTFCNTCMRFLDRQEEVEFEDGTIHHEGCEGSSCSFQLNNKVQS